MFLMPNTAASQLAEQVVTVMTARGLRLGLAESLTGGSLASAVVDVPGASAVLLGSIVAYDTSLKTSLLGVDSELLQRVGAVDAQVASQMARAARVRLAAGAGIDAQTTIGLACTGVAGPDPQDGKAVGTVFIAVDAPDGPQVHELHFEGTRAEIRSHVVTAALELLAGCLAA
jgi:nicotinamide-nucleotide amidase